MPPKFRAKPKAQPRKPAESTSTTTAPTDIDIPEAVPAPSIPAPAAATSSIAPPGPRIPEQSLFIQDDSDEEAATTTGPSNTQTHTFVNDEEDADDFSSATEEGDTVPSHQSDDDDPVVQSYDIIINSKLNEMLHLFQYPVRNRDQPYTAHEGLAPYEARWKVNSGLVELDIPTNIEKNYDQEKGVYWGEAMRRAKIERGMANSSNNNNNSGGGIGGGFRNTATGAGKRRKQTTEDDESDDASTPSYGTGRLMDFDEAKKRGRVLDRQTLGAKIQPDELNYFVGVWRGDQLHLTKLQDTLQLRPQFPHVDTAVEQERAGVKALRELNNPTPARPVEARAINLTVKGGETKFGEARPAFGDTITKDLRKEEDEQWREIDWVDQDMDEAWEMYANLFKQEARPLNNMMSKKEYLHWCSAPRLEPVNPLKGSTKGKIPLKKEKY